MWESFPLLASSRLLMFFKLGVHKNFAILTEKTPVLESLFNEVVIKMEVFYKKMFLKILQSSQENTCLLFNKVAGMAASDC